MPHKHTRRDRDDSTYELPPTQIARPLPVVSAKQARNGDKSGGKGKGKGGNNNNNNNKNKNNKDGANTATPPERPQGVKRKRGAADKKDDTPRAFKRLMAFTGGQKFKSGLDDGKKPAKAKKRKAGADGDDNVKAAAEAAKKEAPTIQPGEKMSDFARRVDAALPVMGLVNSSVRDGKDPLGLKKSRTKKERKMHKLYDEWRREEEAIKERKLDEAEEAEEREMEDDGGMGVKWKLDMQAAGGKKKKKGKAAKSVYEVDDDEDDPWAALKKKRGETKVGLHDHVKAPPTLKNKPKEVLRRFGGATVNVGTIPKSAGSLKRREELQEAREEVVAAYRRLMEGKRAKYEAEAEAAA